MMILFPIRVACAIFLVLLSALVLITLPSFTATRDAATIIALVTNHNDRYLMSFRANTPGGNTLFAAKKLPKGIDPSLLFTTPNGEWLFAPAIRATPPTFTSIYYARFNDALPAQPINTFWADTSADSQYLFYAGVDSTGTYETFNLLRLATGNRTELLVAPLATPVAPNQAPTKLPKYLVPMSGWSLKAKRLSFTSFIDYPCCAVDIRGFYSVDLSNINFNGHGTYVLPPLTPIPALAKRTSSGFLSPDGENFAYIFLPDDKLAGDSYYSATANNVAIRNLITGNTITFAADWDETIYGVKWNADGHSLYYYSYVKHQGKGISVYRVFQYDITHNSRIMLSSDEAYNRPLLCGNQFFDTFLNDPGITYTLYSYAPNARDHKTVLFTADDIDVLHCAPDYQWNTSKIGTCDPFCTPTPIVAVGQNVDVTKLDLLGGDEANGKQLYTSLSCAGCHLYGAIGPETAGTYTRLIDSRLKDPINAGLTAEQYIAQSIVHSDAYIVPTYSAGVMPRNYGNKLSLAQLRDLVAYLMAQK